jgi:hypothetical protein
MSYDTIDDLAATASGASEQALLPVAAAGHAAAPDMVSDLARNSGTGIRLDDPAAGMLSAIARLEGVIDEETAALQSRRHIDLDGTSRRKNRGLLELVRSTRGVGDLQRDPRIADRLTELRHKLERNRSLLQMHLDAVREVSAIIARTIREAESDGTYSEVAPGGMR